MLELAICCGVRCRSALIECVNCLLSASQQNKTLIKWRAVHQHPLTRGGNVYHAQNEIMNPNQEKKNTRP